MGDLIDLRNKDGFKPDVAGLAQQRIARSREALGVSPDRFGELLEPLLGWLPSGGAVLSWETTAPAPGDVMVAAEMLVEAHTGAAADRPPVAALDAYLTTRFADVEAVFATRTEFLRAMPPEELFADAKHIIAAGLSLNLLCQHYADQQLQRLITRGVTVRALFLDPEGTSIRQREVEEGYAAGRLSALTEMNIQTLVGLRERLHPTERDRLVIATYDKTVRFNITVVDAQVAVVQPYLYATRGVDSPTFVLRAGTADPGLFPAIQATLTHLSSTARAR